jgi:glutathione S-transferase
MPTVQPAWDNHFSAFGAQDVEKILADYTEESEIRVFNTATSETAVHKGLGAVRECFVGLFAQLSDLGDLAAPVVEVQEEPRNQVFLVWSCQASGVQRATDTFTFDGVGKILNQNIMITIEGAPAPAAPPAPIDEHVAGGTVKAAWDNHFSAFGAQDVEKILADYTEESEIRVWDHRTQQMNLYTGLAGVRDCFEGIFNTLSDLSALGAPVQVVQEAPRSQVFLQWSCPSSGILEATDTFTFDASGKIKNQNVVLLTAPMMEIGYWQIRGLGAPLRMMAAFAGVKHDAKLYPVHAKEGGGWDTSAWFDAKPALKKKNALMNLPYIIDGDVVVSQTNACMAYLGRKTGLYGQSDTETIMCEQVLCEVMDLRNNAVKFFYSPTGDGWDERCAAHAKSVAGSYDKLEAWLAQHGTNFFAGDAPTAADFHAFEMIDQHAVTEVIKPEASHPLLAAFHARFAALPQLKDYFVGKLHALPLNNRMAGVGATADPLAHKK